LVSSARQKAFKVKQVYEAPNLVGQHLFNGNVGCGNIVASIKIVAIRFFVPFQYVGFFSSAKALQEFPFFLPPPPPCRRYALVWNLTE